MSTLVEIVREKSGASVAEASDARIIEALESTSALISEQRLVWATRVDGSYTRTAQAGIWRFMAEASDAVDSVDAPELHDAAGDALGDLTIDQRGVVTAAGVDALPTAYLSGRVYDVHAAAAEIVGVRISQAAGAFDFKRGDQSFDRSQIAGGLQGLRRQLLAQRVNRGRAALVRSDQVVPEC